MEPLSNILGRLIVIRTSIGKAERSEEGIIAEQRVEVDILGSDSEMIERSTAGFAGAQQKQEELL